MRTDTTILAQLDRQFQWMHAYRRRLLGELTLTLVRKGRGWLTALGRDLDSSTCAKHRRYHESLDNCTPADVYYGRHHRVLSERDKIKQLTMQRRKKEYRAANAA